MKIQGIETFRYDMAKVGDLVDESVVDAAVNALPPACLTRACVQLGEPYSTVPDHTGRWRNTYATFSKVCEGVWQYCGNCYRGETEEPYEDNLRAF